MSTPIQADKNSEVFSTSFKTGNIDSKKKLADNEITKNKLLKRIKTCEHAKNFLLCSAAVPTGIGLGMIGSLFMGHGFLPVRTLHGLLLWLLIAGASLGVGALLALIALIPFGASKIYENKVEKLEKENKKLSLQARPIEMEPIEKKDPTKKPEFIKDWNVKS